MKLQRNLPAKLPRNMVILNFAVSQNLPFLPRLNVALELFSHWITRFRVGYHVFAADNTFSRWIARFLVGNLKLSFALESSFALVSRYSRWITLFSRMLTRIIALRVHNRFLRCIAPFSRWITRIFRFYPVLLLIKRFSLWITRFRLAGKIKHSTDSVKQQQRWAQFLSQ